MCMIIAMNMSIKFIYSILEGIYNIFFESVAKVFKIYNKLFLIIYVYAMCIYDVN